MSLVKVKIQRTINLPVDLIGKKTLSVREEGADEDVTGKWRKVHSEELSDL